MENYDLLWIDLETTGSDPDFDKIIEIGAILTDSKLHEKARFSAVVGGEEEVKYLNTMSETLVRNMHDKNGLLKALEDGEGEGIKSATDALIDLLVKNGVVRHKPNQIVLAGSGVGHFDRRFIEKQMPALALYLKYYVIDVGVMRRAFAIIGHPELTLKADGKTHRAMDDIKLHISEMFYLRDQLNQIFVTYPLASKAADHNKSFIKGTKEE